MRVESLSPKQQIELLERVGVKRGIPIDILRNNFDPGAGNSTLASPSEIIEHRSTVCGNCAYYAYCYQLMLFPAMVVSYSLGLMSLYSLVVEQSIFLTTILNFLLYGQARPSPIHIWYIIAIPLYAIAGVLFGKLLENHLNRVNTIAKLVISMTFFQLIIHVVIFAVKGSGFLDIQSGW